METRLIYFLNIFGTIKSMTGKYEGQSIISTKFGRKPAELAADRQSIFRNYHTSLPSKRSKVLNGIDLACRQNYILQVRRSSKPNQMCVSSRRICYWQVSWLENGYIVFNQKRKRWRTSNADTTLDGGRESDYVGLCLALRGLPSLLLQVGNHDFTFRCCNSDYF